MKRREMSHVEFYCKEPTKLWKKVTKPWIVSCLSCCNEFSILAEGNAAKYFVVFGKEELCLLVLLRIVQDYHATGNIGNISLGTHRQTDSTGYRAPDNAF